MALHASRGGMTPADISRVFARVMPVSRGLFALRYLAAEDERAPPAVSVQVGPNATGDVRFTFAPDAEDGILRKPGDALVLASAGDAAIVVTIFVAELALADGVTLKLDRLDRVSPPDDERVRNAAAAKVSLRGEPMPIHLSGHVERQGDVTLVAGEALGGRSSGMRIEGFTIHWPGRPLGIDIAYGCSGAGEGELPSTLTGGFAGTRGRARPVERLSLRLVGEKAGHYALDAEAIFADGSTMRSSARELMAVARRPGAGLVGLSVRVRRLAAAARETTRGEAHAGGVERSPAQVVAAHGEGKRARELRADRVRVYRGGIVRQAAE